MAEKKRGVSLVGLIFFFIILIGVIVGCFVYANINPTEKAKTNEIAKEEVKNEVANVSETEKENEEEVYFGVNGFFIGTYKENKWYSTTEFGQDKCHFTVNMPSKVMKKNYKVEELDSLEGMYGFDETGFLGKQKDGNIVYSEGEEEYRTIYTTRLKYDEILPDVEESKTQNLVLSSKNTSPFSKNIIVEDKANYSNYQNYVKAVLDSKEIGDLPVNITKVVKGDFDLDQIEEFVIIAETERTENGDFVSKDGAYSFVIWVKENDVSVIMERTRTKEELAEQDIENYFTINEVFVTDMNKNGNVELIVMTCLWDIPEVYMFEYDGERFELIEYGNYAW